MKLENLVVAAIAIIIGFYAMSLLKADFTDIVARTAHLIADER